MRPSRIQRKEKISVYLHPKGQSYWHIRPSPFPLKKGKTANSPRILRGSPRAIRLLRPYPARFQGVAARRERRVVRRAVKRRVWVRVED
jgi:hypothetical protein